MWPDPNDGVLARRDTLSSCARNGPHDELCDGDAATSSEVGLRDFMAITKALADEQRVRVLLALERGELCVCQIVALMGLATSTISKHMSILKQARLVDSRKQGRWIYYRRADKNAHPAVRRAIAWVIQCVGADPRAVRDKQRLAEICTQDPHELCVSQGTSRPKCP